MSKFRDERREPGLGDLLEGGSSSWIRERFILYLILILILDFSFARIPRLLSHGLFIYLCRVLLCLRLERVHSSPFLPPPPSFEQLDRWRIANSLLIFFFFAEKKFKRKKFRFDTLTCFKKIWSNLSFVFCFTIRVCNVECDLKIWI